jgi:hypothetical protein
MEYNKRQNKFCSSSCSAKFNNSGRTHTEETREKISNSVKTNPSGFAKSKLGGKHLLGVKTAPRKPCICPTCGSTFIQRQTEYRVFCSMGCVKKGGFRNGSGRAKTGYYQGIYCGSTYELAFLIWNLDHNVPIKRCEKSFEYTYEDTVHNYYPDFEIDDNIYEITGKIADVDFVKIAAANAILIDKIAIKPYIEYVASKHSIRKDRLWILYEKS